MSRLDELYEQDKTSDKFWKEIHKTALRMIQNRVPAYTHDLTQETSLRIWKNLDSFDPERGSLLNYVRMTANSVVNRFLKEQYQEPTMEDTEIEDYAATEELSSSYFELAEVFSEDKELLDLFLQGYTFTEIGSLLDISPKALRYRLEKVRKKVEAEGQSRA